MKNSQSHEYEHIDFILLQCGITDEKQYGEFLKNILHSAPDSMLIVNQRGRIIFANSQVEKAFGYTQAEILGKPIEILMPESYREKHVKHVQNYFEHPYTRPMGAGLNLVGEHKNKVVFPVEICIAPIEVKNGVIALAIVRDITERKKTQEKIDALNQQVLMSAKRAGMAEITNAISHHLGNLLNSANTSVEILLNQTNQLDYIKKVKQVTALIDQNASTLADYFTHDEKGKLIPAYLKKTLTLIEKEFEKLHHEIQVLQKQLSSSIDVVSRQEQMGASSVFLEPVFLLEIIQFAIQMSEIKNIKVALHHDIESTFILNTDKIKLLQILSSVLMNAKESLLKSECADRRITITIQVVNNHYIKIAIQDNGIGITEENLKRLFSFGFSTKHKAYGFGLHNSFLLAKELNGSIEGSSDGEGMGATFILTLPLEPVA